MCKCVLRNDFSSISHMNFSFSPAGTKNQTSAIFRIEKPVFGTIYLTIFCYRYSVNKPIF